MASAATLAMSASNQLLLSTVNDGWPWWEMTRLQMHSWQTAFVSSMLSLKFCHTAELFGMLSSFQQPKVNWSSAAGDVHHNQRWVRAQPGRERTVTWFNHAMIITGWQMYFAVLQLAKAKQKTNKYNWKPCVQLTYKYSDIWSLPTQNLFNLFRVGEKAYAISINTLSTSFNNRKTTLTSAFSHREFK